jgi:HEPN domain-containing protein
MSALLILVIFGSAMVITHWLKEICITLRDKTKELDMLTDKEMIKSKPWKAFVLMAKGAAPFQTETEPCKKLNLYHNALEKLLKGIISSHGEQPAKIHDLMRLMSQARIENLQSDIKEILDELNTLYYSTRYPEDFDSLHADISEDKTALILKETRKIFSWLEKKLN